MDDVELPSRDGGSLRLRPLGYEFPCAASHIDSDDWDANWLIIHGYVATADGATWSFEQPCLTTWEAAGLTEWLQRVANRAVMPYLVEASAFMSDGNDASAATFTEPNLAFSVANYKANSAVIRSHLSLESLPPWIESDTVDNYEYSIVLDVLLADVAQAADDWHREIAVYPPR